MRLHILCGCAIIKLRKEQEKDMQKFLTDLHTHTTYSHDGQNTPAEMLAAAQKAGIAFYGVSEHFDYDYDASLLSEELYKYTRNGDPAEYFHALRHLQEDYEGVMNVAVGAEFGYSDKAEVQGMYALTYEKYRPDFVINSVHSIDGKDFAYADYEKEADFYSDKKAIYGQYLRLIRDSLDVPYHYDIVAHIGYAARYVQFEDKTFSLEEFGEQIDDILQTIIKKDKILEVNSANKTLPNRTLPAKHIIERYFELGGRKVSFGSDAHFVERIADKREEVVEMLKKIGFTYITVPFRGEHIKVEI